MKIEFLVNVPDKYTGEKYVKGQIKEFEEERANEILSARRSNGKPYAVIVEDNSEINTEEVESTEVNNEQENIETNIEENKDVENDKEEIKQEKEDKVVKGNGNKK